MMTKVKLCIREPTVPYSVRPAATGETRRPHTCRYNACRTTCLLYPFTRQLTRRQALIQHSSSRFYWINCNGVAHPVKDGNKSVGHGSNGSPFLDGSHGSWVTASDPL